MNERTRQQIMKNRELLKGYGVWDVGEEETDQSQKLPALPPVKASSGAAVWKLPSAKLREESRQRTLADVIEKRHSCRAFAAEPMTLEELSWLLWASQGIRRRSGGELDLTFRSVPSAGARHPLETYLFLNCVEGMKQGIYHYLPQEHALELLSHQAYGEELLEAVCGQRFALRAQALFVWSAVPYRTEWRYGEKAAKYILLDAGHACENLYLAAEAAGLGCCAIGAYDQEVMDELLGFPPGPSAEKEYECTVYLAAVGKRGRGLDG